MKEQTNNSEKQLVWVEIKGTQLMDGQLDQTELMTQGRLYRKKESFYIIYDESEATGFEGSRTLLKIDPDRVLLTRTGQTKSNLLIEHGKRNVGYYDIGVGEMTVGVNAATVASTLNEAGGEVFFSYALDINGSHVSDNEVKMTVKLI